MAPSPSSPPSPPTGIPTQYLSTPKSNKPPPLPWTHEETLNLIRAYQDKWYSLKRGQLKASQWEEVSVAVAAYCGLDEPSKSATQCRHKIEKLRKRYRADKLKPYPNSWIYFTLMEHLERGPLPISAVAPAPEEEEEEDSGGDEVGEFQTVYARNGKRLGDFRSGYGRLGTFKEREIGNLGRKRKDYEEEEEEEWSDGGDDDDNSEIVLGELAAEMRGFAEKFVRIERKKMEVMRENERFRMEMENKRLKMILVSQQKTVEMISKIFGSAKRR